MIDVEIHFKSRGSRRQRLPALPRPGDYLTNDGRLWRVDSLLFNTPSTTWGKQPVIVYAVAVAEDRRDELEQEWAFWDSPNETTQQPTQEARA